MRNNILAYLIIGLIVLSGCEQREKNYAGVNNNPITDVVNFASDYTSVYPTDGYFTDRANLESAVSTMLKSMYPYCDKGSAAKVNVLFGDVTQAFEPAAADETYELTAADYDAMGEESGQPAKYNNFYANMDVDAYFIAFLIAQYSSLEIGKPVTYHFLFFSG